MKINTVCGFNSAERNQTKLCKNVVRFQGSVYCREIYIIYLIFYIKVYIYNNIYT